MNDIEPEKNPITPTGFRILTDELKRLRFKDRPEVTKIIEWAAGNGDRSENGDYIYGKKKLREIDSRIRFLNERLRIAEVIDSSTITSSEVQFGATVIILDDEDRERTFQIVGVDEVDAAEGRISWKSPLVKALLKGKAGDLLEYRSPKGVQGIEIVSVTYGPIHY